MYLENYQRLVDEVALDFRFVVQLHAGCCSRYRKLMRYYIIKRVKVCVE